MTYAWLAALFVAGAATVTTLTALRRSPGARWWLTTGLTVVALLVLTVVFDSLMIMADLFRFDEGSLLGIYLWHAPIEDLAWPLVAGLLLPSLHVLLGEETRT